MSLTPQTIDLIPEQTIQVARVAFPKGNIYMRMRDELGTIFSDEQFAPLFARRGQPAYSPWRLALVCVMQYVENLSDRQAAEAVRARIDWKYTLSLELTDPGFDYSVLSEFRKRLVCGQQEKELLDTMLGALKARGLLNARGKQRTDSSHVIAAVRDLNRLESVGETLRTTLNSLASLAPQWLSQVVGLDWFDRYAKRFEESRLPKDEADRIALADTIGTDGMYLLDLIFASDSPNWLAQVPAVETLRQTWIHQYYFIDGQLRWREAKDLPPSSVRYDSPYDPEAHYGTKRCVNWTGYKVHITETCDPDSPHLITHVETTIAPKSDVEMTEPIHQALSEIGQLPSEHLVDSGYVNAALLVSSQKDYQVELVGPIKPNVQWQAKDEEAYSIDQFSINWEAKTVTCPQGQTTRYWKPATDAFGNEVICIRFSRPGCAHCPARSRCTRSEKGSRSLTLRPQLQHQAIETNRQQQNNPHWKKRYAQRAGIEGTVSQGVRAFGLRQARYIGRAKTHLQHLLTACAINVSRLNDWLTETPMAKTRVSRFSALRPLAA